MPVLTNTSISCAWMRQDKLILPTHVMVKVLFLECREDVAFLLSRNRKRFTRIRAKQQSIMVVRRCSKFVHFISTIIIFLYLTTTIQFSHVSSYLTICQPQWWKCNSIESASTEKLRFMLAGRRLTRNTVVSDYISYSNNNDFQSDDDDEVFEEKANLKQRNGSSSPTRPYWEKSEDEDDLIRPTQQPTSFQSNDVLENDVLEWEKYMTDSGTTWILLPPLAVTKPTCIIHFVGGTFLGTSPQLWYRTLLQDLVRHTSCAIVATSIPVTIARSPLNHVRLSTQLLEQFRIVYNDVIIDEYGRDAIRSVPICGMGHSLGARLLAVSTTLTLGQIEPSRKGQASLLYKSMILISFTNYAAAAGIPGIATLSRKSRNIERQAQRQRRTTRQTQKDTKWWNDDDDDDDDFDDSGYNSNDEDTWSTIWNEVSNVVQLGASRIQNALTPPSDSLEFYPTPEQLWTAIRTNGRYNIPHTLVVQFDDDEIDQSSRLATSIMNCSDVKFARMRGTHLTPITISDQASASTRTRDKSSSFLQQMNIQAERILVKTLQGRQQSKRNVVAFLELRQSIARYIIDIVAK